MTQCQACLHTENPERLHIGLVGTLRFMLCRKCVGELVRQTVAYIRDFDKKFPKQKKPHRLDKVKPGLMLNCRDCLVQREASELVGGRCVKCAGQKWVAP